MDKEWDRVRKACEIARSNPDCFGVEWSGDACYLSPADPELRAALSNEDKQVMTYDTAENFIAALSKEARRG